MQLPEHRQSAWTLIEMLIAVSIIGLLAAILMPSMKKAQSKARSAQCIATLRALSLADDTYAGEHDGKCVPIRDGATAQDTIWVGNADYRSYLSLPVLDSAIAAYAPRKFICPEAQLALKGGTTSSLYPLTRSYAYNVTGLSYQNSLLQLRKTSISKPSQTIRMVCSTDWWVDFQYADQYIGEVRPPNMVPAYRHDEAVNVVFFDGHAEAIPRQLIHQNEEQWKIR